MLCDMIYFRIYLTDPLPTYMQMLHSFRLCFFFAVKHNYIFDVLDTNAIFIYVCCLTNPYSMSSITALISFFVCCWLLQKAKAPLIIKLNRERERLHHSIWPISFAIENLCCVNFVLYYILLKKKPF